MWLLTIGLGHRETITHPLTFWLFCWTNVFHFSPHARHQIRTIRSSLDAGSWFWNSRFSDTGTNDAERDGDWGHQARLSPFRHVAEVPNGRANRWSFGGGGFSWLSSISIWILCHYQALVCWCSWWSRRTGDQTEFEVR